MSPTCAATSVEGVAGCQNGVGVGVEMSAIEAVLPPLKRVLPPMGALRSGDDDGWREWRRFWDAGRSG